MGTLDIGLAMVVARIASREMEKDQEIRTLRENREKADPPEAGRPSLTGAKLEVVRGQVVLIPSAAVGRKGRRERPPRKQGDATVVPILPSRNTRRPE